MLCSLESSPATSDFVQQRTQWPDERVESPIGSLLAYKIIAWASMFERKHTHSMLRTQRIFVGTSGEFSVYIPLIAWSASSWQWHSHYKDSTYDIHIHNCDGVVSFAVKMLSRPWDRFIRITNHWTIECIRAYFIYNVFEWDNRQSPNWSHMNSCISKTHVFSHAAESIWENKFLLSSITITLIASYVI